MSFIQEATDLSTGRNLQPVSTPYALPDQKDNVAVFLMAGSYEYDLELIKKMPPPRTNYKNIIIPYSVASKIGPMNFKYQLSQQEYKKRVEYLMKQKMVPQLTVEPYPIKRTANTNVYVPISDVCYQLNRIIRELSPEYMSNHVVGMMNTIAQMFSGAKRRIWIVNTDRVKIYDGSSKDSMNADLINGLLGACIAGQTKSAQDTTVILRSTGADYKLDLRSIMPSDSEALQNICSTIGVPFKGVSSKPASMSDSSIDDLMDEINADTAESDQGENATNTDGGSGNLKQSLKNIKDRFGIDSTETEKDELYNAKTFEINASLIHRISPNNTPVSDYKRISQDLEQGGDHPVENQLINQASSQLAGSRAVSNDQSTMNTVTSAREMRLRSNIGQIRLKELNTGAVSSVTDVPLPPPIKPLKLTTTNHGALHGSSFPMISKEYEEKMMDQDIVATFMTLQKLPEGFVVTNVEVTDISDSTSLIHNWKVSLKNKKSGTQSHINIRVPKMVNGRFLYNGSWYTIGKQEFPIPILKINKKLVMLTSNYNKISVQRYDTKSLVDLTLLMKAVAQKNDANGKNPYVKYGSSSVTNSRFVSTIEYDEFAKKWFSYENKERKCRIIFNREQCLREFNFVTVNENEFCCGMIDQVPIVINTETGLDRHNRTITDNILPTLPEEILKAYNKGKPAKLSMYAEMKLMGIMLPVGVSIAAWEGLSSLLKRSGAQYRYIGPRENAEGFMKIPFKDKTLAVQNTIQNQLLFNGFYRINTRQYTTTEFESTIMDDNSIYVDMFNQIFFKQFSQKTTFITNYHFFVDAITEDVCHHYKLPDNLCDMLVYASNLLADNNFTSENNASLYRIRSSEIIPAMIHHALAVAISKYNNTPGSKFKESKLKFNPNEIMTMLMNVQTIATSSALNPMIELHETENVSKKGFGGVNEDKAYSEAKRSFDDSMVGKIAISTPNSGNVGINRQLTVDPKLESVRGYTSTAGIDADYNDLQLASFSELLTPGTVSRDDAIRTAIATSQTGHILPTDEAEPVLVSNGVDELVAAYVSDEFAVTAQENGKVLEISDGYMIVEYASKKKQAIPVSDRYSFNPGSGFFVDNKLKSNFEPGDTFEQNDILAYHEKFFSKDSSGMVRMNVGPLAKVAFCGTYATYEDAGMITEKMSKRLGTHVTMRQASKLNATDDVESIVKVGDEVEIGDPLIVFGLGDTGDKAVDAFLKAFQSESNSLDSAKRIIKSKHAGTVKEIRMYTTKGMDKLSPSLFELFDAHFKENIRKRRILDKHDKSNSVYKLDTLYSLPTEPINGQSIKGQHCDVMIEIYIEHGDDVSIGDKCVVYAASKQVISEVIPEGQEPFTEDDPETEISMFVSAGSIMKRMIPSMIVTASANKILVELKRKIGKIWNG